MQGTQSPDDRRKLCCFQWCNIPRIQGKCEGCGSVCASIKNSPLVDYAGGGGAGAAPGVAGAHARGVVRQGRQLPRQLPALHQKECGGLRCRPHLHGTTLSLHRERRLISGFRREALVVKPSLHILGMLHLLSGTRCLSVVARTVMMMLMVLQALKALLSRRAVTLPSC